MLQKVKKNFYIDTKKIMAMAIIIALYILFSWLSKIFNLTIFPATPFLKIEFTDFIFLLALRIVGIFYSIFLTIIVSWLRLLYLGNGPIDVLALMLADLIFLIIFWLCDIFLRKGFDQLVKDKNKKSYDYGIVIMSIVVAIIGVSFLMTLFNWWFIYDMYGWYMNYPPESIAWFKSILVPIIIPFNLIKFTINGAIFIAIYRAVVQLQRQFQFPIVTVLRMKFDLSYDLHEELYF